MRGIAQPKDSYGRTQAQREWQDYNSHYQQRVQDIQNRPSKYGNTTNSSEPFTFYNYKPSPPKPLTPEEKKAREIAIVNAKKEQRRKDSLEQASEAAWQNQVTNMQLNIMNGQDTTLSFSKRERSWLNAFHFLDSCNNALRRHNDYLKYNNPNFKPFPLLHFDEHYISLANLYYDYGKYEDARNYYQRGRSSTNQKTIDFIEPRILYYELATTDYPKYSMEMSRRVFQKNKIYVYYLAYAHLLNKQIDSAFAVIDECLKNDYFKGGTDNYNLLNSAVAILLYQEKDSIALNLYNIFVPQKVQDGNELKKIITSNMAVEIATTLQASKRVPMFVFFSLDLLNLILPESKTVAEKRYSVFSSIRSQRGMRPIYQLWPKKEIVTPIVPETPKPKTMADVTSDLELAIEMAQTVDLKSLRGGVDIPTKVLSFGIINHNSPNLKSGLYSTEIKPGNINPLIDSLYHNQEAIFDKLAIRFKWTKKASVQEYSKKETKEIGYSREKLIFYYDEKGRMIVYIKDCGACGFNKLELNSYYRQN